MAEIEVSPQEEMANLQGLKVLPVERPGLPKDFVMEILRIAVERPGLPKDFVMGILRITSQRSVALLHEYIL